MRIRPTRAFRIRGARRVHLLKWVNAAYPVQYVAHCGVTRGSTSEVLNSVADSDEITCKPCAAAGGWTRREAS